ncbi:MAG: flavin reductase [Candidatus Abyssobacteria bacterium SURF_17]|jgi:flavin reductase (DIM6/NTAB) family NADH-FMN oxidoreductase RutF|uniref:Flavin reductase n=1 Tax=Candidatus Abyssobacteria bacterium SURF_17 TaxID=2093361 RepID=A0A419F4L0_9BACT|nr:MAG: flavin reductase [Candidatus Abyssubacteria bacterium SURF_17]
MNQKIIDTLSHLTYGIYILTSKQGDENHGMIASWVSQVSHEPPLVMVAIRKNRRMHPVVKSAGAFALHVLEQKEKQLIRQFKLPTPAERFHGLECITLETGCPIIKQALAFMECRLVATYDTGDHTLFIGEVLAADCSKEGRPMTGWDYGKVYLGDS